MRVFKVWILTNSQGEEIARGRKCEVEKVAYFRYVYQHIFTDCLIKTNENL